MLRVPIIAANWKMNKNVKEAENYAAEFPVDVELYKKVEVVIMPPYTALQAVGEALRGTGIKLGAQNMHYADSGAYTGEISPLMLKELGCSYVILGHSERRHIFQETDELINKKVKAALNYGISPLLCVGETLEERESGKTREVNMRQLLGSLKDVEAADVARIVIGYEPVWAIGTGVNASGDDAEETIAYIREIISGEWGKTVGQTVRIQYGGSVKPDNIKKYLSQENIDGALVGGAGLEVDSFYGILRSVFE